MTDAMPTDPAVTSWLELAATWRFLSLLFQSPTEGSAAELRALALEVSPEWRAVAQQLSDAPLSVWQDEFHRVLGPGGIPACESSYDDNALAGRGPVLARIVGYYDAFLYRPDDASPEVPDHVSIQTGFLAYLALKAAFAALTGAHEALAVTRDAYNRFADEHLLFWLGRFRARIAGADSEMYTDALLARVPLLRSEPGALHS